MNDATITIQTRYRVSGMDCASCAAKVEGAVLRIPGVKGVSVSATTGNMTVRHSPATDLAAIESKVAGLGYGTTRTLEAPAKHAPATAHDHADCCGHDHGHGDRHDRQAHGAAGSARAADNHVRDHDDGHGHTHGNDHATAAEPTGRHDHDHGLEPITLMERPAPVTHGGMLEPVADCQVLIAGGMGQPAFERARATGLEVILTSEHVIAKAAAAYAAGTLASDPRRIHQN